MLWCICGRDGGIRMGWWRRGKGLRPRLHERSLTLFGWAGLVELLCVQFVPVDPDRVIASGAGSQAGVASRQGPGWRQLSQSQEAGAWIGTAYRLRVSAVPEHRRVLEPQDCDVHAARRHLHAAVRILRGAEGASGGD